MNRFLLTMTAFAALTGAASAADMPVATKAAAIVRPACAQFGGFYIGGNVGAAYYTAHRNDDDGLFVDNAGHTLTDTSWAAGVQGGYNFQRHCTVFGVEADWSWTSANATFQDNPNAVGALHRLDSKLKWFGTARARSGVVVDDLLIYATGGFAWANINNTYTDFVGPGTDVFSVSNSRYGFAAGVGTEWKFADNWSLKSEALYIQLKQQQDQFLAVNNGGIFRFTNNDNIWTARIGINYIFGGGAVRAAY